MNLIEWCNCNVERLNGGGKTKHKRTNRDEHDLIRMLQALLRNL